MSADAPPPDRADTDGPGDRDRRVAREALVDTLRPYAGWLFFGFAALLVLLGWVGISGESIVAKQLPYLISGGIGGVLLAVLGATFLGMEELRRDSGRLDRMERQIEELHRILLARPDAPDTAPTATPGPATASANGRVLVVERGESYHRPGCTLVAGKSTTEHDPSEAADRGLRPCPVCEPASHGG